jgi:integrase
MSIRKREWVAADGRPKSAWVVDYRDGDGKRRHKTFPTKKAAEAWGASTRVDVAAGVHTPDSASITIAEAAKHWLAAGDEAGLERTTMDQRRQHADLHIVPFIGARKLSQFTAAQARAFESTLRSSGRSEAMVGKILTSLSGILSEAQERGNVRVNVVREMRGRRKTGKGRAREKRRKGRIQVGVDIPTPVEVRAIVEHATPGRWRTLLMMAALTGLRASELRGLRWERVDLDGGEVEVAERADRYNEIGNPKSLAGSRRVPLTPALATALKEWKLRSGGKGFVFGTRGGAVPESLANIVNRALNPAQVAAGITRPMLDAEGRHVVDEEGNARLTGRYSMHALRHFFASWCINPRSAGGLELPAKVVQERLGHETIAITLDMYSHLFPRGDDRAELAAGEQAIFGAT